VCAIDGYDPDTVVFKPFDGRSCLSKGEFYAYHLILSVLENRGLEGSVIETKSRTTLRGKGRKSRRGK
jgi:hypothetical protein